MKNFTFKNPSHHIVDSNPQFKEELKKCTSQREARHLRNLYIRRLEADLGHRHESEQEKISLTEETFSLS